jgi:hypothetical protein
MEHMVFKSANFEKDKITLVNVKDTEFTFTATSMFINGELIYRMSSVVIDPDGYEYDYTLFDLAEDPSIIDKIINL